MNGGGGTGGFLVNLGVLVDGRLVCGCCASIDSPNGERRTMTLRLLGLGTGITGDLVCGGIDTTGLLLCGGDSIGN